MLCCSAAVAECLPHVACLYLLQVVYDAFEGIMREAPVPFCEFIVWAAAAAAAAVAVTAAAVVVAAAAAAVTLLLLRRRRRLLLLAATSGPPPLRQQGDNAACHAQLLQLAPGGVTCRARSSSAPCHAAAACAADAQLANTGLERGAALEKDIAYMQQQWGLEAPVAAEDGIGHRYATWVLRWRAGC